MEHNLCPAGPRGSQSCCRSGCQQQCGCCRSGCRCCGSSGGSKCCSGQWRMVPKGGYATGAAGVAALDAGAWTATRLAAEASRKASACAKAVPRRLGAPTLFLLEEQVRNAEQLQHRPGLSANLLSPVCAFGAPRAMHHPRWKARRNGMRLAQRHTVTPSHKQRSPTRADSQTNDRAGLALRAHLC